MRFIIALTLLYSVCYINGELLDSSTELSYQVYKERVKILAELISSECADLANSFSHKIKREVHPTDLEVEKILYQRLKLRLIECRNQVSVTDADGSTTTQDLSVTSDTVTSDTTINMSTSSTTQELTTTMTDSTTTVITSSTTSAPIPVECRLAYDLDQPWRLYKNATNPTPGVCDKARQGQWFRFSGEAGNQLLNYCPLTNSCGSQVSGWSPASVPSTVGVQRRIKVYGSGASRCGEFTWDMTVIRCSSSNDFVYRYDSRKEMNCNVAFCGMLGD